MAPGDPGPWAERETGQTPDPQSAVLAAQQVCPACGWQVKGCGCAVEILEPSPRTADTGTAAPLPDLVRIRAAAQEIELAGDPRLALVVSGWEWASRSTRGAIVAELVQATDARNAEIEP